ncbi:ribosome biogenesis protein ytm1 [Ceratobasidium sp. 428]|nr:ribosome biogenesis protein ytm1 [Ceratobasidium sp. 428]
MSENEAKTHPITLTTRTRYVIPASKYMIPAAWARYHLSQLINKVLSSAQPVPFDFLINGELLTGSLAEWCSNRGVGEEETLDIEYIESVLPPELLSSQQTDDWMASISCTYKNFFLTASYDGCVRVHDSSRQAVATISSHSGPVTSACWVSPNSAETFEGGQLVASASFDHTVHFTRLSALTNPEWSTLATLHLHTAPVSSVTASSSGHHLISAGWDGLLGVWTTNVPDRDEIQDAEEMMPKKRRKVEKGSAGALKKAPAVVLRSHMLRLG